MAHKVIGVDLGDASVKIAVLETSFRQSILVDFLERPLPEGDAPSDERGAEVLRQMLAEEDLGDVVAYAVLPGDKLSLRLLELPFADEKKLEQVVGYELESQIPYPLEDVVIDHQVVATGDMTKVLCAAAPRETVRRFIDLLSQAGAPPRALYAAPLCYGALVARTLPGEAGPVGLVDIGHERTNICILSQGRLSFGRTLSRGGRHLTLALAAAYQMRYADAERGKLDVGAVGSASRPLTGRMAMLDSTLRDALGPIVRDLKQTLAYYRTQFGQPVGHLLLCGGTSRLRGLCDFLTEETGVPVSLFQPRPDDLARLADPQRSAAVVPLAFAAATAGATGRREHDFRKGEFAYRVDYSFLRAKAFHLAACFLAVLAFAAIDAYAALHKLRKEEAMLETRLRAASIELFGKEVRDPAGISREIRTMIKGGLGDLPIPETTAFDLLIEISRKMPTGDDKKLDVLELDMKPKKTFIKGTVASAAAVDEIVSSLKTIRCFEEIQKGPIQNVVGKDLKQFTLTISGKCP